MTLNGIEVDEAREDESADLISSKLGVIPALRAARSRYKPDKHVHTALAGRIDELGGSARCVPSSTNSSRPARCDRFKAR
jgi:hypothetical protein